MAAEPTMAARTKTPATLSNLLNLIFIIIQQSFSLDPLFRNASNRHQYESHWIQKDGQIFRQRNSYIYVEDVLLFSADESYRQTCKLYLGQGPPTDHPKVKPEDVEKNKKDLIEAYNYLAAYYADPSRNDCANVKLYMQKIIELDSTNAQAKKVLAGLKC